MAENFFEFREKVVARSDVKAEPQRVAGTPLSVVQLTRQIEKALKEKLPGAVLVKGEVSNFNAHHSGHVYFTLKDPQACIDCVVWRSDVVRLKFLPKDGVELLAEGRVVVYAQRGRYQLQVSSLQPLGTGGLELAFQQLRKKLAEEGLFDGERKKELPIFPRRIAIVTGAGAAALFDMLKVLRKFPWLKVMVYTVPVQGDGAGAKIAEAIKHLAKKHELIGGIDAILLGRGGGSLEDLWAFNEEAVARAIAASPIPVITGIGHEVDVSIADLVADYHAHTPTEAAQVITANWKGVGDRVDVVGLRLRRSLTALMQDARRRLESVERHEAFRRPLDYVNQLRQVIDDRERSLRVALNSRVWRLKDGLREMEQRLARHSPQVRLHLARQRIASIDERLRYAAGTDRQRRMARVDALERHLNAVSPESVLRRGFSLTTIKKDGAVVRSAKQIKGGEKLVTRLADGTIESVAEDPRQPKLF